MGSATEKADFFGTFSKTGFFFFKKHRMQKDSRNTYIKSLSKNETFRESSLVPSTGVEDTEDVGLSPNVIFQHLLIIVISAETENAYVTLATELLGFSCTESTGFPPRARSTLCLPVLTHSHCLWEQAAYSRQTWPVWGHLGGQCKSRTLSGGAERAGLAFGRPGFSHVSTHRQLEIYARMGCPHLENGVNDSCPVCLTDHCRVQLR